MTDRTPLHWMSEAARVAALKAQGLGSDLLPLDLTTDERKAAQMDTPVINPGPITTVSPTGTPIFNGTGLLLKLAAAVVGLAGIFLANDFFPATHVDETIASVIITVGTMLGIASPGVRKTGSP